MSDEGRLDYKYPRNLTLTIAVLYLSNYFQTTDQGVIARARDLLGEHNIKLDVWPEQGTRITLDSGMMFGDRLVEEADYAGLENNFYQILRKGCCLFPSPLPVLFCNFRYPAKGLTLPRKAHLNRLVLISPMVNQDKVTLLHEMGHAAGMNHDRTSTDPMHRNFMHEAETRTTIMKWQVETFAHAVFAVGR